MSRTVYKIWADRLENARTTSIKWSWPEARFSQEDLLIYLVTDGVYSTSIHGGHWSARRLVDLIKEAECPGTVRAFSYAGYGSHYLPEHTVQPLPKLRSRWVQYIENLGDNQRVIPICFSLGGVVALLGFQEWLKSNPSNPAAVVPVIILVAPAHAASTHLTEGYEEKVDSGEIDGIPTLIRQLCNPKSRFREETVTTLRNIPTMGIKLHVLYWPADKLTPYDPDNFTLIDEHPVMSERPLKRLRDAAKEHMRIQYHQDTETELINILRVYR